VESYSLMLTLCEQKRQHGTPCADLAIGGENSHCSMFESLVRMWKNWQLSHRHKVECECFECAMHLEDDLHFHVGMWHIANVRAIGSSSHALSISMLSCMALH
jgi:hypothetical protein